MSSLKEFATYVALIKKRMQTNTRSEINGVEREKPYVLMT